MNERARPKIELRTVKDSAREAETNAALSRLPSVDAVLSARRSAPTPFSQPAIVESIREVLATLRDRLRAGDPVDAAEILPEAIREAAHERLLVVSRSALRRVVNATGVVLHTNLGRALLADSAIAAVRDAAGNAVNLEYDLERGTRGDRDDLVEAHLCALTGAEAATVVNNNAAAVVLVLNTLARDREVLVSRGELIEIGGSFRIPDIMAASGARLREVGTTNRTHLSDYCAAIGPDTALLMKVHASNYRIVGFAASVELRELAALASSHPGVAVVEDLGAGAIVDLASFGLAAEPVLRARLRDGADLVLASGDKLLGGPQCGIIAGRADLVARLRRNPLKRALRCDKLTLAALEATLRIYRYSAAPEREVPTLRYLTRSLDELREIGEAAIVMLADRLGSAWTFELAGCEAEAGSGSQPAAPLPSIAIAVRSSDATASQIERVFRSADPPVIGRIHAGDFLLDLRLIERPSDLVPAVVTR